LAVSETEDPTTALVALKRCGEVKLGVMLSRPKKVVKVVRESGSPNMARKIQGKDFFSEIA